MSRRSSLEGLGCAGLIAALVVLVFASPFLSAFMFIVGAFFGWLMVTLTPWFAQWIINGAGLFHIELTMATLPLFVAMLGFVGGYFKSTSTK